MRNYFFLLLFICSFVYGDPPKICLTMIVKNESRIITRLLDSVKPFVDCISICDTGSTDNTIEIIEKYMKTQKIPGIVHRNEWKNFGYNRTLSAKLAQETIKKLGFSPQDTYLLLLDADMVIKSTPKFNKSALVDDGYQFLQHMGTLSYYNIRLVRAAFDWECVGVTHEYWSCKQNPRLERLESLFIDDLGDGGAKSDKFERDIALLIQGLKDEPENSRYMFYLAQSYRDIQNYPLALEYYEKRVNAGGWVEEIFESLLQIAIIQENMKMPFEKVVEGYKRAYVYRPTRAEPLYFLARYYRDNKKYEHAYQLSKLGMGIPYPEQDILFVSSFVYEWGMKLEASVNAYWVNRFEESKNLCQELLGIASLPKDVQNLVRYNLSEANLKVVEQLVSTVP